MELIEEHEELDESWIKEFDKIDKEYEYFYKENNYYINVRFVYIHKDQYIEKIINEKFFMKTPNYISKEDLVYLIKKNKKLNSNEYSLFSILKYNILLEPLDLKHFLLAKQPDNFLIPLKNIEPIVFEQSINLFQDLNDLFIFYYDKPVSTTENKENTLNVTKKVYIKTKSQNTNKPNTKHRKTYKNQHKDFLRITY